MATKKTNEHEYTVIVNAEIQVVVDEKTYNKLLDKETHKVDPEKFNKLKEKDCKFYHYALKKAKTFER